MVSVEPPLVLWVLLIIEIFVGNFAEILLAHLDEVIIFLSERLIHFPVNLIGCYLLRFINDRLSDATLRVLVVIFKLCWMRRHRWPRPRLQSYRWLHIIQVRLGFVIINEWVLEERWLSEWIQRVILGHVLVFYYFTVVMSDGDWERREITVIGLFLNPRNTWKDIMVRSPELWRQLIHVSLELLLLLLQHLQIDLPWARLMGLNFVNNHYVLELGALLA